MPPPTPKQLLNTTWTLHRLSPLHHGKEFQTLLNNPTALKTYATRLRDQLTGDVLGGNYFQAGINGTADDDALSKTGALRKCTWETLSGWPQLNDEDGEGDNDNPLGILVVLEYEFTTYKAALLARPERMNDEEDESHEREGRQGGRRNQDRDTSTTTTTTILPLLLTKFPNPLRQIFISFLSANFDTYCSLLRLPSNFLCAGLETYLNVVTSAESTTRSRYILENVVKEVHLTLSFSQPVAPALRTLNVSIPRETLIQFIYENDNNKNNPLSTGSNSFLTALDTYLEKHVAIKLNLRDISVKQQQQQQQQHVRLSKIACGGFVLGTEGRLKLIVADNSRTDDDDVAQRGSKRDTHRLILRASEELLRAAASKATIRPKTLGER